MVNECSTVHLQLAGFLIGWLKEKYYDSDKAGRVASMRDIIASKQRTRMEYGFCDVLFVVSVSLVCFVGFCVQYICTALEFATVRIALFK